jgi:hypothetical protein
VPVAGTQVLCTGTGVLGHEYEIFFFAVFFHRVHRSAGTTGTAGSVGTDTSIDLM